MLFWYIATIAFTSKSDNAGNTEVVKSRESYPLSRILRHYSGGSTGGEGAIAPPP